MTKRKICILCGIQTPLDASGVCRKCRDVYEMNLAAYEKINESELSAEFKSVVALVNGKIEAKFAELSASLSERDQKISLLESELCTMRKDLKKMEEKLDEFEACDRKYSIIVSGKSTPMYSTGENTKFIVGDILKRVLRMDIPSSDILSAFRIGRVPSNQKEDRRAFSVKFRHHETATDIKRTAKTMKPDGLYFSENLTPLRHSILKVLRKAKYSHPTIISGCGSWEGRVFVWTKPSNPAESSGRNKKFYVNSTEQLRKFCNDLLNNEIESYTDNWNF